LIALAVAVVGLVLGAEALMERAIREDLAEINDAMSDLPLYPRKAVVCDVGMGPGCARRAAERLGSAVAWVDPDALLMEHKAMVAIPRAKTAFQDLVGRRVGATITSNDRTAPAGTRIGSVRGGERTGQLWRDWFDEHEDFYTVVWRENGVRYSLSVYGKLQIPYEPATRADVQTLFDHVQLTDP
jgi:hypothetical protein